jgi:RNA polymerase sigma factor (sigma-70 family)
MKNINTKLEADYQPAYDAWKARPDPTTAGALVKAVGPVLDSAVRTYGGAQASKTLRSRAKQIAVGAFDSYKPETGPLKPHLMSQLQGLRRRHAQQQQIISVPERVSLDRIRTEEAGTELEDQLGRMPSDNELADYTGISVKRLAHIRKAVKPLATGTLTNETPEGGGYLPESSVPGKNQNHQIAEFVMDDLNPTDQVVLQRMLGMNGLMPMSPSEIAGSLGISQSAISQRVLRIQAKLDELLDTGVF